MKISLVHNRIEAIILIAIPIAARKAFDKTQQPFMIKKKKKTHKLRIKGDNVA
jgi:hypothetical protein